MDQIIAFCYFFTGVSSGVRVCVCVCLLKKYFFPWPGWSIIPYTKRLGVQFPVSAYIWVVSSYGRQPIDVHLSHQCFSLSLLPSLSKSNEHTFKKRLGLQRITFGGQSSFHCCSETVSGSPICIYTFHTTRLFMPFLCSAPS